MLEWGGEIRIISHLMIFCSNALSNRTDSNILLKFFLPNDTFGVIKDVLGITLFVGATINRVDLAKTSPLRPIIVSRRPCSNIHIETLPPCL